MAKRALFEPRRAKGRVSKWTVNLPASYSECGKRERHFFGTKEAAETFCQQTKTRIGNYGTGAISLPPAKMEQAAQAFEKLKPFGISLNSVVEEWITRRQEADRSVSFEFLLEEFAVAGRHDRRRSPGYRQSILQVRNRLVSLHGRLVSEITPAEINQSLQGMTASVRNFTVRILSCAFNLAVARGHLRETPMRKVEHAAAAASEIALHTPAEVGRILAAAEQHDPAIIPFLAISFFAGLRRSEVLRLDWSNVEIEERYIRLPKQITKTSQGRHIPMEENLARWLTPHALKVGLVVPFTSNVLRTHERALRKIHGVLTIKHGPRHCFGSYWLGAHENIDRLMLSMGHTDFETTREHYAKAVTRKSSQLYWNIGPTLQHTVHTTPAVA